jgi:ubiquinone/menaquinone biosynthesis C-methylase UbiE
MNIDYAKQLIDKTKRDYNLIADDFSRTRNYIWPEITFLFKDIKLSEKVLDLGCGNGRYYQLLKNTQYIGVDNSEKLIKIANQKYPEANFQAQDALSLSFEKDSFDKVYSIAVLHHIPSQELRLKFLEEAKRVLKPNGKIIVTVWKLRGLKYFFLKNIFKAWSDKTSRYYHLFSKRELANLFKKAGFKIEKIGVIKNTRGNRQNIYIVAQKCS